MKIELVPKKAHDVMGYVAGPVPRALRLRRPTRWDRARDAIAGISPRVAIPLLAASWLAAAIVVRRLARRGGSGSGGEG
jgi:hypothetical protein